jgi:predicted PurR-regulated permease PerM
MTKKISDRDNVFQRILATLMLGKVLEIHENYYLHSTKQISGLIAICAIILTVFTANILSERFIGFNILIKISIMLMVIASSIALIFSLYAEFPQKIIKKIVFHPLSYLEIADSLDKYKKHLSDTLKSEKEIINNFSEEIDHIKKVMARKYQLVRTAMSILLSGVLLSGILIVATLYGTILDSLF